MRIPLKNPKPDIESFKQTILRKKAPKRPPFIELHIDKEIVQEIVETKLDRKWVPPVSDDREAQAECLRNYIEVHYRLGYDFVRLTGQFRFSSGLHFASRTRDVTDTASLSRGERQWTEEGAGMINSWEDFEKYPWPSLDEVDPWATEFVSKNMPEGMGILACPAQGIFECGMNTLFGYQNLSYMLYDDPDLVKAAFDKTGELLYSYYESIVGLGNLAGFFQGEDMGFNTNTLVSADALRKYVLPWHKKIAQLAHDHNLIYILHSCGNLESIMEDLIDDVKMDAKHSFEDTIMPVTEYKEKYGNRVGVAGGVDVDKLCRLNESDLRKYVRDIIGKCSKNGGYALGTGNSVANYVPLQNFLIMLDEGLA